jgi:hopanoid biosynthesis associated RND transporter like protein HpnN
LKINPVHWLLRKILFVQTSFPLLTFLVALALAALSILYTVRNLEFQTSQKDLISPKERLIQLADQVKQFEQHDSFVVVMESGDPRRSLKFLQSLVPRLEEDKKNYLEVFYRVDPQRFKPWALLYLDRKDLLTLAENVQEHRDFFKGLTNSPTLINFFEQINQEMSSRMVGELFTGFLDQPSPGGSKEPFDLDFLIRVFSEMKKSLDGDGHFTSPWGSWFTKESLGNDSEEGYFWTKNKRYLVFFVTPTQKEDFAGTLHSLTALRKAIAQVQASFPDVKAGVTGPEALNVDQMGTALEDMSLATLISIGGLGILLVLFWWGLRRPFLEMIRLLIDLCLTFGVTTLFVGHLNILSVTFAPLLLGLGIDYGVHWFARYMEEEKRGFASKKEALEAIMDKLAPGLLLAGLTAVLSFLPLVLTGFKGLVELGIICAMGMAITTLTSLSLLPALILLFDKPRLRVHPSPLSPLIKPFFELTRRRVLALLVFGGIGFAFSVWGATKVRFDLNMLHLQSPKVESVVWEKKLLEGSELSSIYGEILSHSLREVRQKTKALESLPTVSRVESVDTLLPRDQEDKIAFLRKLKGVLAGMGALRLPGNSINREELEKILGRIRFKMLDSSDSQWGVGKPLEAQMVQVRDLIEQLCQRLHSLEGSRVQSALGTFEKDLIGDLSDKLDILRANVNGRTMGVEDLPAPLLERFMNPNQLFRIRVFPKENIWEPELLGRFVRDLRSVDPDAVGDPVTLYVFTQAFRDGCIKAALYAVAFIFIFLLFTFRDFRSTFLALVPLGVGTAWTLGLMHLLKVNLNLANSLFLPLVVGAALEYAIIILHRWRQHEKDKAGIVLPFSTAMGVILAGLTTTVGFGSLCISAHRGIFSLGLLTTVGSLAILAAAILFLPAFLQFFFESKKGKPAGSVFQKPE